MNLEQYVKELLYKYECVVIPELGAFLTQSVKIHIDRKQGIFYPNKKRVSYNALLTQNDGLLANYITKRNSISYEDALKQIQGKVKKWKDNLKNNTAIILPGIGELRINSEEKIHFSPSEEINFDTNSIGLVSYKRKPILKLSQTEPKTEISNTPVFKKTNVMEDSKKSTFAFTPKKGKRRSNYFKYAAVGLLAIVLISGSFHFLSQYISEERLKSTEQAQEQIKSNVQQASFDLGELTTLELNVVTKNTTKATNIVKGDYFSVIAGSYREKSNANKMLRTLREEGFDDAAFAKKSPEGLFRIAYGRFKSKKEALNLYYFLQYTLERQAWFLEE